MVSDEQWGCISFVLLAAVVIGCAACGYYVAHKDMQPTLEELTTRIEQLETESIVLQTELHTCNVTVKELARNELPSKLRLFMNALVTEGLNDD